MSPAVPTSTQAARGKGKTSSMATRKADAQTPSSIRRIHFENELTNLRKEVATGLEAWISSRSNDNWNQWTCNNEIEALDRGPLNEFEREFAECMKAVAAEYRNAGWSIRLEVSANDSSYKVSLTISDGTLEP